MEEGSQSSDGERSFEYRNDDDDYVEDRSHDSSEDRSYGYDSDERRRRRKQRRTEKTQKQDRISNMPHAILLHILSFLPTKDAVKTGTLSQRWLYLWTSVPNLDFDYYVLEDASLPKFVTFVDRTLIFHKCCNVKKFRVEFDYESSYASSVDSWVRFATRANVEELSLELDGRSESDEIGYRYVLPHHVYKNSSLTKLSLKCCDVAPNGLISWISLKNLWIEFTELSEDVIQKILVGSPVLEILELDRCCGFNRLDIGSVSLRKLVVRDYWDSMGEGDESVLEISAPNLQSLGILGRMHRKMFRLIDVQSLVDCNLDFKRSSYAQDRYNDYEMHRNVLRELLQSLHHVKKLTLGTSCIEVLSILDTKGMLSPMTKRKCIIIADMHIPGIASLLQSSPNLETLVIDMTLCSSEYRFDKKIFKNYWTSRKGGFKCSLLCLKTVKIVGFEASRSRSECVIQLVQFLLESARVLEKVVIKARKVRHMECSSKELLKVAQKLLSLPRSSPRAVVIFSE